MGGYSFGPAPSYFLIYEGRGYDYKAIAGVAHDYRYPERGPLKQEEFSGRQGRCCYPPSLRSAERRPRSLPRFTRLKVSEHELRPIASDCLCRNKVRSRPSKSSVPLLVHSLGDALREMKSSIAPTVRTVQGSLSNRATSISVSTSRSAAFRRNRICSIRAFGMAFHRRVNSGSINFDALPFH